MPWKHECRSAQRKSAPLVPNKSHHDLMILACLWLCVGNNVPFMHICITFSHGERAHCVALAGHLSTRLSEKVGIHNGRVMHGSMYLRLTGG